jgi:hypothetical protein
MLASPQALGLSADVLRPALSGNMILGHDRSRHAPDAVVFHGPGVNCPAPERVGWIAHHLGPAATPDLMERVFRPDLFNAALAADPAAGSAPSSPIQTADLRPPMTSIPPSPVACL